MLSADFNLRPDCIHIWSIDINDHIGRIDEFNKILSVEEMDRASRFHFDMDQYRYIVTHGILRMILGGVLEIEPRSIIFDVNDYGKPSIQKGQNEKDVFFSISHSKDALLICVCQCFEIGVDVEVENREFLPETISNTFFTDEECNTLEQFKGLNQKRLFLKYWTRKEAFIKAIGLGVNFPLDEVSVADITGETWVEVSYNKKLDIDGNWYARDLYLSKGIIGALTSGQSEIDIEYVDL